MTKLEATYVKYGMDYDATIERCAGDEQLLLQLLCMFAGDGNFDALCCAFGSGDTQAAFRAAHALKGSSGMLGMTQLHLVLCDMTECLRRGDISSAAAYRNSAEREYETMSEMIKSIC